MQNELINTIKNCEDKYISCFCEITESEKCRFYSDDNIKDMYDHNFMAIKEDVEESEIKDIIKNETERCKEKQFCKIRLPYFMENIPLSYKNTKGEVEHLAAYCYKMGSTANWKSIKGCTIKKVVDDKYLKGFIDNDVRIDAERCGEDFCIRRCKRLWDVYIDKDKNCDLYICFYDNKPVGSCELFLSGDTAKIESFAVDPEFQRRGIGTELLKYLVETAVSNKAKTVYLVADEDDTPKEMYLKLGFEKVFDMYSVLWTFK